MRRLPVVLTALALVSFGAMADERAPADVASLMFENPQWDKAPAGTTLTYRFERKTVNDAGYGPSFKDDIRLYLGESSQAEARDVRVELFSGERRMAAGPFSAVTSNPALILFLEFDLGQLSSNLHANPRYLKNAIRAAMRDKATVEKTDIMVGDTVVPGRIVVISPFVEDPNKGRMNGLDSLTYTFALSDAVPGQIADIHAQAKLPDGSVALDERLSYEPRSN